MYALLYFAENLPLRYVESPHLFIYFYMDGDAGACFGDVHFIKFLTWWIMEFQIGRGELIPYNITQLAAKYTPKNIYLVKQAETK